MSGNSMAFKSDKYCCYAGDLGNTWDRVGKAENCEEHPVRDSNPCYQIENLAS